MSIADAQLLRQSCTKPAIIVQRQQSSRGIIRYVGGLHTGASLLCTAIRDIVSMHSISVMRAKLEAQRTPNNLDDQADLPELHMTDGRRVAVALEYRLLLYIFTFLPVHAIMQTRSQAQAIAAPSPSPAPESAADTLEERRSVPPPKQMYGKRAARLRDLVSGLLSDPPCD